MREAERNNLKKSETYAEATSQNLRAIGRKDTARFVQYLMFVAKQIVTLVAGPEHSTFRQD